ncbi:MAG: ShlB/FhaC/HecB family hemolysin secretion/activation protein [Candidatus Omnitrophica bacterium]|nr:ShlB/FhaC/HecB family hemolysin secretion/activation protein [Candidatus Omnitrophota bacterium]
MAKIIALKTTIFSALIFSITLLSPSLLRAQNIPAGEQPGAQAGRFQQDVEKAKQSLEKKRLKLPPVEIEKEKEEKPAAEGVSFILKEIRITGTTIFKPEDFRPIYEPYLNKTVSFKDLEVIMENIKAKYKEKGYLTTTAYIPEQEVKDGKIEIRVLEGRLGEVKVEENKWFAAAVVKRYIHAKKGAPLNILKLQKDLLRLNQNPDLEIKAILSKGQEVGTSDIIVKVADKFPYHVGASVDNLGTRLVGRYRTSISFRSTNLTGGNDSIFVNTLMSRSSAGDFVSYKMPLDTYGTDIGIDYTYFRMRLGKEYRSENISGDTQIYTPYISKEIYLSERLQANIKSGLEIKSVKNRTRGRITTNDQLRLPYLGFEFTGTDSLFSGGQTTFLPKFVFGTSDFLGASPRDHTLASRAATGGFFFKYEQVLQRIQKMPFDSYLSIRSQFQSTTHTLPSSEQLQLGGAYSVRGYPEGDYLADVGANLNLDWVFPMYLIPESWKLPHADTPLRHQIEPVVFVDLGGGRLLKPAAGERRDKVLLGVGGGLKVRFNKNLFLNLLWADHIGNQPTDSMGESHFHMTFQFEI